MRAWKAPWGAHVHCVEWWRVPCGVVGCVMWCGVLGAQGKRSCVVASARKENGAQEGQPHWCCPHVARGRSATAYSQGTLTKATKAASTRPWHWVCCCSVQQQPIKHSRQPPGTHPAALSKINGHSGTTKDHFAILAPTRDQVARGHVRAHMYLDVYVYISYVYAYATHHPALYPPTHLWLVGAVEVCELPSGQETSCMVQHSINATIADGLGANVLSIISGGKAQLLSNILQHSTQHSTA